MSTLTRPLCLDLFLPIMMGPSMHPSLEILILPLSMYHVRTKAQTQKPMKKRATAYGLKWAGHVLDLAPRV